MERDKLEEIGAMVLFIIMAIVAVATDFMLILLSAPLGLIVLSPLYLILSKTKYGYKHKWVGILQILVIIIIHIILVGIIDI